MSDTPRTDELAKRDFVPDGLWIRHARQLERENAALTERVKLLEDQRNTLNETCHTLRAENADLIKRLEAHDGWDDYNAIKGLQADNATLRKDKDRLDWLDCRTVSRLDWVLTNVEMHKLPIRDAIDVSMKEVEP